MLNHDSYRLELSTQRAKDQNNEEKLQSFMYAKYHRKFPALQEHGSKGKFRKFSRLDAKVFPVKNTVWTL